jgi:hypothetical protein
MGQFKESNRKQINIAAGNFLSDQDEGDNYDAYLKLLEASEKGDDDCAAADYVNVWQPLEHLTVAKMIETIENAIVSDIVLPEFLQKTDWTLLKEQKKHLLDVINIDEVNPEQKEALEGLLNYIDSIQDYMVDEIGLDENLVFDLHDEEEDKLGTTDGHIHPEE